jgi:4-amino-4-deoxy-L-arabinose transferase-like glycosyltransferase
LPAKTIQEKQLLEHIIKVFTGIWGITLLALVLRLAFLGQESLWTDEVVTLRDSLKPLADIVGNRWDPHPPLFYLVMHNWAPFGSEEAFLRLPSAIFSTLTVPAMIALGKHLRCHRAAWASAMLFAVSPLAVWYAQEVRMYAMVAMWAVLSTWLWVKWLEDGNWWVTPGYILATIMGLYTHYTMGLIVLGQNLWAIAMWFGNNPYRPNIHPGNWLLAQLAILLLYTPWFPVLPEHWQVIRRSTSYPLWRLSTTPVLIAMALLCFACWSGLVMWYRGIKLNTQQQRWILYPILLGLILMFLGLNGLALSNRMTTLTRQTFVLFPFLCLALSISLFSLPHWRKWTAGLALLCLAATLIMGLTQQKPPWRNVVAWVEEDAQPGDVVIFSPSWLNGEYQYYAEDSLSIVRLNPNALNAQTAETLSEADHIWFIRNTKLTAWSEPEGTILAWLHQYYDVEAEASMGELSITRFRSGFYE